MSRSLRISVAAIVLGVAATVGISFGIEATLPSTNATSLCIGAAAAGNHTPDWIQQCIKSNP